MWRLNSYLYIWIDELNPVLDLLAHQKLWWCVMMYVLLRQDKIRKPRKSEIYGVFFCRQTPSFSLRQSVYQSSQRLERWLELPRQGVSEIESNAVAKSLVRREQLSWRNADVLRQSHSLQHQRIQSKR